MNSSIIDCRLVGFNLFLTLLMTSSIAMTILTLVINTLLLKGYVRTSIPFIDHPNLLYTNSLANLYVFYVEKFFYLFRK